MHSYAQLFFEKAEMIYYTATANAQGHKAAEDAGVTWPNNAVTLRKQLRNNR